MEGEASAAGCPKKHSPFMQVVFRKSGEAMDLGGKSLIGLSGLGHVLGGHNASRSDWRWLVTEMAVGGLALLFGIYLQAKAEETLS